ncbi:trans-aconitate 2-methyltransferase [Streptacidiphilus sp. MAP12-20]|uniref:class I SAM-dependent methyltransferase n=1 Tax=Streptacidiphilus sp. MAP12-20 TaxID=3156299 RepID=UPI0035157C77
MERSMVFGTTAAQYDAYRPGYPDALVTTVLEFAGIHGALSDVHALEVGAGTGKATVAFAGRGVQVLAVEPDPRMAELLRGNTAATGRVEVEVARFEEWSPGDRRFGLAYAAQAWHWLDPDVRRDRVYGALAPDGTVALFWNLVGIVDRELFEELAAIDARWDVGLLHNSGWAGDYAGEIEASAENGWVGWEFRDDDRFTDQRSVRLRNGESWQTTRQWTDRLATHSGVQVLDPADRAELLATTAAVLDARGGGLDAGWFTDLFLARAGEPGHGG